MANTIVELEIAYQLLRVSQGTDVSEVTHIISDRLVLYVNILSKIAFAFRLQEKDASESAYRNILVFIDFVCQTPFTIPFMSSSASCCFDTLLTCFHSHICIFSW
jgi:hypothetical protein